jgi:hypothetical protein
VDAGEPHCLHSYGIPLGKLNTVPHEQHERPSRMCAGRSGNSLITASIPFSRIIADVFSVVTAVEPGHVVLVEHVLSKAADLYLTFTLRALYLTLPYG